MECGFRDFIISSVPFAHAELLPPRYPLQRIIDSIFVEGEVWREARASPDDSQHLLLTIYVPLPETPLMARDVYVLGIPCNSSVFALHV